MNDLRTEELLQHIADSSAEFLRFLATPPHAQCGLNNAIKDTTSLYRPRRVAYLVGSGFNPRVGIMVATYNPGAPPRTL